MVLAASLEFSPLDREQRAGVLARADAELLTPVGLRTLSPDHQDYVPRYGGGVEERDRAYHQGTVWPWLLGFYVLMGIFEWLWQIPQTLRKKVRDGDAADETPVTESADK